MLKKILTITFLFLIFSFSEAAENRSLIEVDSLIETNKANTEIGKP